jgi:hypothetical protein
MQDVPLFLYTSTHVSEISVYQNVLVHIHYILVHHHVVPKFLVHIVVHIIVFGTRRFGDHWPSNLWNSLKWIEDFPSRPGRTFLHPYNNCIGKNHSLQFSNCSSRSWAFDHRLLPDREGTFQSIQVLWPHFWFVLFWFSALDNSRIEYQYRLQP